MKQLKYPLYASFLVLLLFVVIISIDKLSSSAGVPEKKPFVTDDIKTGTDQVKVNSKGFQLFRQNCASCHALDKVLSGPPLRGVEERGPWTERKNLIKWVKNPAAFIPATEYTTSLQKQYGQIMPSFMLSEKEINEIFDYIKQAPVFVSQSVAVN